MNLKKVMGQLVVAGFTVAVGAGCASSTDEQSIPEHRMDLRLYPTPAPFRAAIVNRGTGDDIPYPVAMFDGKTLTLQMGTHDGPPNAGTPFLRMTWDGTRFEGTYVDAAFQPVPKAVQLKLIKSQK